MVLVDIVGARGVDPMVIVDVIGTGRRNRLMSPMLFLPQLFVNIEKV